MKRSWGASGFSNCPDPFSNNGVVVFLFTVGSCALWQERWQRARARRGEAWRGVQRRKGRERSLGETLVEDRGRFHTVAKLQDL
jgi:hypothetical protein